MKLADLILAEVERLPRHRLGDRLLKGPITWTWLEQAMAQPGRAVHVALYLWHHAGMLASPIVPLNLSRLGIERTSASRGLAALERAGLVRVVRGRGRKAVV